MELEIDLVGITIACYHIIKYSAITRGPIVGATCMIQAESEGRKR